MATYMKITATGLNVDQLRAWVGVPIYNTDIHTVNNPIPQSEKIAGLDTNLDPRFKANNLNDWEKFGGGGGTIG